MGEERKTDFAGHHRSLDPGVCSRTGWAVSSRGNARAARAADALVYTLGVGRFEAGDVRL
jgi:hypothetical protein